MRPAEKIRLARLIAGLSQEALDVAVGVPVGRTFSYEKGRAEPGDDFVARASIALGVTAEWINDGARTWPPLNGMTPQAIPPTTSDATLQVMGLIPRREPLAVITGKAEARTSFPPPKGSYCVIAAQDADPVRRGDLLMIVPTDAAEGFVLGIDEDGVERTFCSPVEQPSKVTGRVVMLRRDVGAGVFLMVESLSGLTCDLLTSVLSV